jgi:hypothetical protein
VNRGFWCGDLRERKIYIQEVRIHWIDLPHDWDRKLAVVNAILTFRAPQNAGNFLTR